MVRSSLPSLRMRDLLSRLLVVMVLVSVVVATDVVPGLRWDRLEIWENSASHDVWTRLSEYVEFRSYVLGAALVRAHNPSVRFGWHQAQ